MDWIEIKMEVQDREAVEGISNMLAEMGTGGVMIEDPQAIADYADSGLWDAHEFSEDLLKRKDIYIKSYLPQDENLMNRIEQIIIELNEIEIRMDMGPTRVTYKPVQEEDMELVLSRCIRKYQQRNGQLVIRTSMGTATAHINNIVYVNSDLHYIDFVLTTGESLRTKMQMRQVEELLQPYPQFIRCHQSYLVNLDYVREVQRQNFLLKNINEKSIVSTIPISRKYLTQTKEKFVQHNLRSGRLL